MNANRNAHFSKKKGSRLNGTVSPENRLKRGLRGARRRARAPEAAVCADSELARDLAQSAEHCGAFGGGESRDELFAQGIDAPDAFVKQGLPVFRERDLHGTAVFRVLNALKEILLHEGFDELG